jgi:hypothetical protein
MSKPHIDVLTVFYISMCLRKPTTNLEHRLTRYIDFGARKPYITSDFEDYADGYLYIVYYTIIYEPGVNPSLPYRYDLNFVKSDGFSWWSLPSLATFRSASGEVPIYCSIDYEDDTLYLAYIGESTRDIRVRRSIDFGSSWSSPTILKTGNVFEPEVAVGDSTHAIVMYTAGLYPDQDP